MQGLERKAEEPLHTPPDLPSPNSLAPQYLASVETSCLQVGVCMHVCVSGVFVSALLKEPNAKI